ncbi:MAG: winged helix-turn-helix domain-containing protein [Vicinamibacterales bacterium]
MTWHFPPFRLDPGARELWRGNQRVPLQSRAIAVLDQLLQQAGRLVTKETLLQSVWSGKYVTVENVKVSVGKIRKALGDDVRRPRYIETYQKHGYRFIGPLTVK